MKLGDDAERLCPNLPWPDIRGLGNKLRLFYQDVDLDIVWNLITTGKLNELKACVHAIDQLDRKPPP